ncbi:MAG: hypothetical protein JJT76_07285 [Clostridiaceae bacterium]|nr:hypothetical protein [Clostridiaceae bacterium]
MEKLKDILHDFSDVIFAFVIIIAMFTVITFNLGDWFDNNSVVAVDTASIEETNIPEELTSIVEETEVQDEEEEKEEDIAEIVEEPEIQETEVVEITIVDSIEITIPNGTPGVGIAKILLDNQLIESTRDFVETAEELNLALKLKSGTFDIPTNATLEDIVRIIAR